MGSDVGVVDGSAVGSDVHTGRAAVGNAEGGLDAGGMLGRRLLGVGVGTWTSGRAVGGTVGTAEGGTEGWTGIGPSGHPWDGRRRRRRWVDGGGTSEAVGSADGSGDGPGDGSGVGRHFGTGDATILIVGAAETGPPSVWPSVECRNEVGSAEGGDVGTGVGTGEGGVVRHRGWQTRWGATVATLGAPVRYGDVVGAADGSDVGVDEGHRRWRGVPSGSMKAQSWARGRRRRPRLVRRR